MATEQTSTEMTLKQFAESVRVDPNALLQRIHNAGLSKYSLSSVLEQKDKERIIKALRRPKHRLERKALGKKGPAARGGGRRGKKSTKGGPSAASARGQDQARSKDKGGKQARAQDKGGKQAQARRRTAKGQRRSQARAKSGKTVPKKAPRSTPKPDERKRNLALASRRIAKPVTKPVTKTVGKPKGGAAAPSREKKNKRTRQEEIQDIMDRPVQRYGIRITNDDIVEIEELMHKDNVSRADSGRTAKPIKRGNVKIVNKHGFIRPAQRQLKEILLGDSIRVSELASQLAIKVTKLKECMKHGGLEVHEEDQILDKDAATLLVEELGHKVIARTAEAEPSDDIPPNIETVRRPPIITVMGHVDHGKTTLLDYIRNTKQVEQEAGNITQHLGAYTVTVKGEKITFLDTPGHAAFSAMRARGAQITDIVILIVAADEGVRPQTAEAIKHATSAQRSIVVALNKMDKPNVDTEKVRKELAALALTPEEWGGEVQFVEIAAKTGKNVAKLLEAILVQADVLDLRASRAVTARGRILESRLDKNMGPVATLLVRHGVLKKGDCISSGSYCGRIKIMRDDSGRPIQEAEPSEAVEIFGLNGVPQSGDVFVVCANDKEARGRAEARARATKEQLHGSPRSLDAEAFMQEEQKETTKINLIIKADVTGSLEAITALLATLTDQQDAKKDLEINVVAKGVGAISAADITLAKATASLVLGFNVRPDNVAKKVIKQNNFDGSVHYFSVIYELGDELQRVIKERSMLRGTERIIGIAEVKQIFRAKTYGQIAGCLVTEGRILKKNPIRVLRSGTVIYEGVLESLRRFKEDVQEVQQEVECGIGVKDYKDVRVGDQIEVYDKNLSA